MVICPLAGSIVASVAGRAYDRRHERKWAMLPTPPRGTLVAVGGALGHRPDARGCS